MPSELGSQVSDEGKLGFGDESGEDSQDDDDALAASSGDEEGNQVEPDLEAGSENDFDEPADEDAGLDTNVESKRDAAIQ